LQSRWRFLSFDRLLRQPPYQSRQIHLRLRDANRTANMR
jgi:hypothetical protein